MTPPVEPRPKIIEAEPRSTSIRSRLKVSRSYCEGSRMPSSNRSPTVATGKPRRRMSWSVPFSVAAKVMPAEDRQPPAGDEIYEPIWPPWMRDRSRVGGRLAIHGGLACRIDLRAEYTFGNIKPERRLTFLE